MSDEELKLKKAAMMKEVDAIVAGDKEEYTVPIITNVVMGKMQYASYKQVLFMVEAAHDTMPLEERLENLYTNLIGAGLNVMVKDLVMGMLKHLKGGQ